MFDTPEKRRTLSRWVIGTFACCVLLYLGIRHISGIAAWASRAAGVAKPLLTGGVMALIFNVPLGAWERLLRRAGGRGRWVRPTAVALALVSVFGLFAGVALLVVPELVQALRLIVQIVGGWLEDLARADPASTWQNAPPALVRAAGSIDWLGLKSQLEEWVRTQSGQLVDQVLSATKTLVSSAASFFVGLVFAVYLLCAKETLARQARRLILVWLPGRAGGAVVHVASVCGSVFHRFVAGQTLEAVILGTLCMAGMAILRIPYAPMVGALVGVTALIPIVGAFVGTIVGAVMIMTVDPFKAVVFVVFLLVLQQVEGNLIYPRVVGSRLNLPAVWVLAAVTVGGNIAGPAGMLLGVPAASAAYALLREATALREQAAQKSEA